MKLRTMFASGGWLPRAVPNFGSLQGDHRIKAEPFAQASHESFMFQALLESMSAAGSTSPNPSVGCVFVLDGQIIARGHTQPYGGFHAEKMCTLSFFQNLGSQMPSLGQNAEGSYQHLPPGTDVYCTLEPCSHYGKQPPCCDMLVGLRPSRVFIGCLDPNPLVCGQGKQSLEKAGILVHVGLLADEIKAWLFPFLLSHAHKLNRPFVALKWAQSLDGFLADAQGKSKWISGSMSRSYTHWLRLKYDCIGVSASTFLADFSQLNVRNNLAPNSIQPEKVVFDRSCRLLDCDDQVFEKFLEQRFHVGNWILFFGDTFALGQSKRLKTHDLHNRLQCLKELKNCVVCELNSANFLGQALNLLKFDPRVLLLRRRPIQSLLIEGGPQLLGAFISESLFDVLHIFMANFLMGGANNQNFVSSKLTSDIAQVTRMHPICQQTFENDTLLELTTEQKWLLLNS